MTTMLYIEIAFPVSARNGVLEPGVYSIRDTEEELTGVISASQVRLTFAARRIWREDEQGVHWNKNRTLGMNAPVDMEEFFWIKLKAKPL